MNNFKKEYDDYLLRLEPSYSNKLNKILDSEKKKYIEKIYYYSFYYSFVFEERIKLSDFFDQKEANVLHGIYIEIYQLVLWVYSNLSLWNILWSYILLRSILERVLILKVLFEDQKYFSKRVNEYIIFGNILKYDYWEKNWNKKESQKYFNDSKEHWKKFEERWHYNFYKWVYWQKYSINALLQRFKLDKPKEMYSSLFKISHWWILNQNLLNSKNWFLPNDDSNQYKNVFIFVIILISYSLADFIKHTWTHEDLIVELWKVIIKNKKW